MTLNNVLANLCHGEEYKKSSCGSSASMEMSAPWINAIVNKLFHSNSHINHMQPAFFPVDSLSLTL